MPVEYFVRYNGQCYDVGTRLRIRSSLQSWAPIYDGIIIAIDGYKFYVQTTDGHRLCISKEDPYRSVEKLIVEIIVPVYYTDKTAYLPTNDRMPPPEWDVAIGWVWYILIIAVGSIFKDRIGIWAMATAYFFLWKNGFFNRKGKK